MVYLSSVVTVTVTMVNGEFSIGDIRARRDKAAKMRRSGEKVEKGDDESRAGPIVKPSAPLALKRKDFTVELDPSKGVSGKGRIPQNEPPIGKIAKQKGGEINESNDHQVGGERDADIDDVGSVSKGGNHKAESPSGVAAVPTGASPAHNKGIENEDIIGATPTGFPNSDVAYKMPNGDVGTIQVGNQVSNDKANRASKNDTLRPMFGMADPKNAIPSVRDQLKSDLIFEDFSIVPPGNGLGVNNKMFLMEEARDKQIVFREPMAEPRPYDGPSMLVNPPPLEWQNEITRKDRKILGNIKLRADEMKMLALNQVGAGSLNILGDDYGELTSTSDKGLNRKPESVFDPIIRRPTVMERVRVPTGQQLNFKHGRRLFDSERYPDHFVPSMAQEGGSTFTRSKQFALAPFWVGSA